MAGVIVAAPRRTDGREFVAAVRASRALHFPWLDPPDTPERYHAYLDRADRNDTRSFLFREAATGRLSGWVNVNNIVFGALCSGYLGYGAFVGMQGRGLMTAGIRQVLRDHVFGDGLHRVEANIQPANERSKSLARRLGLRLEGHSPKYLLVDGEWRDHERWAMTAEQWAETLRRPP